MLKPTKTHDISTKDSSVIGNKTPDHSTDTVRINTQFPELHISVTDPEFGQHSSGRTQVDTTLQSAVVVTEIPGSRSLIDGHAVESALSTITWPKDRLNELVMFRGNSGLFASNDGTLFADIKGLGKTMVERNDQGEYQVPFPFAPGVPGPILTKIDGEPYWRIERPGWVKASAQTPLVEAASPLKILSANMASLLGSASPVDGIRLDKTGRTYAEIINEGTVLIRKNTDGVYQASDLSERLASGPLIERIPGTGLWQRIPERPLTPGSPRLYIHESPDIDAETGIPPAKRPRFEESGDSLSPAEGADTTVEVPRVAVESPYAWMRWGHYEGPPPGESVKLAGFDYSIVPLGSAPQPLHRLIFLQNPEYAALRFDDFERMLRDTPALQPVAIYRYTTDPLEFPPAQKLFHKPLSQSVAERFTEFSEATARSVARNLFERADNSLQITSTGLNNIYQVLARWSSRAKTGVPALGDPMLMLQPAPRIEQNANTFLSLTTAADAPLHRLTFDPQTFPDDWSFYLRTLSNQALRQLTGGLLVRAGYDVFPLTPNHQRPTLIFRGPATDDVFFLKLGAIEGNAIALRSQPGTELAEPHLPSRIGHEAYQAVLAAHANNKLIWLLGGVLNVRSKPDCVFIVRER